MRVWITGLGAVSALGRGVTALSQALRPFEPLNPAKAQSLATSPLLRFQSAVLGDEPKYLRFFQARFEPIREK